MPEALGVCSSSILGRELLKISCTAKLNSSYKISPLNKPQSLRLLWQRSKNHIVPRPNLSNTVSEDF